MKTTTKIFSIMLVITMAVLIYTVYFNDDFGVIEEPDVVEGTEYFETDIPIVNQSIYDISKMKGKM